MTTFMLHIKKIQLDIVYRQLNNGVRLVEMQRLK